MRFWVTHDNWNICKLVFVYYEKHDNYCTIIKYRWKVGCRDIVCCAEICIFCSHFCPLKGTTPYPLAIRSFNRLSYIEILIITTLNILWYALSEFQCGTFTEVLVYFINQQILCFMKLRKVSVTFCKKFEGNMKTCWPALRLRPRICQQTLNKNSKTIVQLIQLKTTPIYILQLGIIKCIILFYLRIK